MSGGKQRNSGTRGVVRRNCQNQEKKNSMIHKGISHTTVELNCATTEPRSIDEATSSLVGSRRSNRRSQPEIALATRSMDPEQEGMVATAMVRLIAEEAQRRLLERRQVCTKNSKI